MSARTTKLLKAALSALHYSGAARLMSLMTRGSGIIFTLHHVRPEPPREFEPNRILSVTPGFLDEVIRHVLEAGFEVLSLDEARRRISGETSSTRPFACFTFDDGYRDNLVHAYPIFRRWGLPFAIYVPSGYPDGGADLWWLVLEEVIRKVEAVSVQMEGEIREIACRSAAEKTAAFETVYWWLRTIPEDRAREVVRELAAAARIDAGRIARDLVMTWDEIRTLAADPLVTIGAHTRNHLALAKLTTEDAAAEIRDSIARLETELGRPCRHFSYPYGDASSAGPREFALAAAAGVATAVTTRKGLLHPEHAGQLTALPRVSLNGDYQDRRYVKVFLSGAPFAILNALSRPRTSEAPA